jgi:hypothetical protein
MSIDPISTPENKFPLGQRIALPGHFLEPVTLEAIRFIGSGYECRVRLSDGTPDEAILSLEEAAALAGQVVTTQAVIHPADAEKLRLLVESARIRLLSSTARLMRRAGDSSLGGAYLQFIHITDPKGFERMFQQLPGIGSS